jgi:hypothetical protein
MKKRSKTTNNRKATDTKSPVAAAKNGKRLSRVCAALSLIGETVDQITDTGNSELPGMAATGFAEVTRWAAREVATLGRIQGIAG